MGADPARESADLRAPGGRQRPTTPRRRPRPTSTPPATTRSCTSTRSSTTARLCDATSSTSTSCRPICSSVATTPNYVFITPDLCNDGHDTPCAERAARRLRRASTLPANSGCRRSPPRRPTAERLLIITFDEGGGDDSSCCGEMPGPYTPLAGRQPGPAAATSAPCCCRRSSRPGTVSTRRLQPLLDARQRRGPVRPAAARLRGRRDPVRV